MAQDQILVKASSLPSDSASVPASVAGNGVEDDSNSNSSPDSGLNDDCCSSEASGSSGSSIIAGSEATVVAARDSQPNSGHSLPLDSEQAQLQQQRPQPSPVQPSPVQPLPVQPSPSQQQPPHVVHVHVHPGETFRVRMGNQIQQIKGPATVRMVSSTGPPPLPMPLQQPPGHVIQQIMDEHGVLTHVILSPQPPNMGHGAGAVPMNYGYGSWEADMQPQHPMQPYPWNGGQGMQPFYPPAHFASASGQYAPAYHHHPMTGAQAPLPRMDIASGNNSAAGGPLAPPHASPAPLPQPYSDDRSGMRKRKQGPDRQQRPRGGSGHGGGNTHSPNTPPRWRNMNGMAQRNEMGAVEAAQAYPIAPPVAAVAPQAAPVCMAEAAATAASAVSSSAGEQQRPRLSASQDVVANLPIIDIVSIKARVATMNITPPTPPPAPPLQELEPVHIAAREVSDASAQLAAEAGASVSDSGVNLPESPNNLLEPMTSLPDAAARSSDATAGPANTASSQPESSVGSLDSAVGHVVTAAAPLAPGPVVACPVVTADGLVTAGGLARSDASIADAAASSSASDFSSPDFIYDVIIRESRRESAYTTFSSGANQILLRDLKPATEYSVKVTASLAGMRWPETQPLLFRTNCCVPDPPQAPTMVSRARSNIMLRWQPPFDNGSKITAYSLEMDQGNGKFAEVYSGSQRSQKVTKLAPSTGYYFRLAAVNGVGKSEFSEVVQFFTSGSLPEIPERPQLVRATSESLSLAWSLPAATAANSGSNGDESVTFGLQMEEEMSQHGFRPVYNGPDTRYTIDRLRRNTDYKFRVNANNEVGPSKFSPIVTFRTLPDSPGAPGRPQTKGKVHPTSFRLSWDPPRDTGGSSVVGYVVQLDYGADFEEVYCGAPSECTCTELHPGFTYRARVAARSGVGLQGPWSELTTVLTPPVTPAACPAPRLHGKAKAHSIEIRWSSPDYDGGCNVAEYKVQLLPATCRPTVGGSSCSGDSCDPGAAAGLAREVYRGPAQPGNMSCTIAGLLAGQQYLVQVRAINKAGEGPWSEPLSVTTGAAQPSQPAPPQCLVLMPHSVAVNWCEPESNGSAITEYRLYYSTGCDDSDSSQQPTFTQVYSGPALTYEVKGLLPATCYAFKVAALNSAGASECSIAASCTTAPSAPGPVPGVSVLHVQATTVRLQWQAPASHGSAVSSYEVDCGNRLLVVDGSATECDVDELQPLTAYNFRVRAINHIGSGPYCAKALKVTTSPLPPAAPELEVVLVSCSVIKLKWTSVSAVSTRHSARSTRHQGYAVASAATDPDGVSYTLHLLRDGKSPVVLYNGTALTHKVSRLMENTVHKFQVYATNSAGNGQPSDVHTVVTHKAQPPALKAPSASHVTPTSVRLTWPACQLRSTSGDSVAYVVQLAKAMSIGDGAAPKYEERYRGSALGCTLTELEPTTGYWARVAPVRVCHDDGSALSGAFSPCVEFGTGSGLAPASEAAASAERTVGARGRQAAVDLLTEALQALVKWPVEHAEVSLVGLFVMLCLVFTAVAVRLLGQ